MGGGWTDGWSVGAICRLDEWVGVGLITLTAGYHMLPQDAARYHYRYV